MSGGVDSSVAAARLIEQGFDVVGVTLHLWDYPDDGDVKSRCCAPEDIHDARRVCDLLGVPHFAFDRRELFQQEVVQPFVDEYLQGTTPSPCVRCNRSVKVKELVTIAGRLQASAVATGHYARVDASGSVPQLLRGKDRNKDQSYFLHMLDSNTLRLMRFPLGEATKAEVREQALQLKLPGATKGESQELCFVPTGRYDAFVDERAAGRAKAGALLDFDGQEVGRHEGIHRYTVGQRKNLGVALGERAYVVEVDPEHGAVRLGSKEDLLARGAVLGEFALAEDQKLPLRCEVAVRYRGQAFPATVEAAEGGAQVVFDDPVSAVVPGQVAVLYAGERVLGGGVIRRALPFRDSAAGGRRHLSIL
jgi:tRNA-uridine 2-sulfurtransferase